MTCACLSSDARECYDLRYYGYAPVLRGPLHMDVIDESLWRNADPTDDGECACVCHSEDERGMPYCSTCGYPEDECTCYG